MNWKERENSPRPDLFREKWVDLNGIWKFAFDDEKKGVKERWFYKFPEQIQIKVPYCYQCKESGIGNTEIHKTIWYERHVELTPEMREKRLWLHFGAADQIAQVWVNGMSVGIHRGGFTPFSFDISGYVDAADSDMKITVCCQDDNEALQVRGKQHWDQKTDRCWYTATSGIWQNVWLELTEGCRMERIKLTPDIDRKTVDAELYIAEKPENGLICWKVSLEGTELSSGEQKIRGKCSRFLIPMKNADPIDNRSGLWEPKHPVLYDLEVEYYDNGILQDQVGTYFGMRKIEQKNGKIYLNHVPLYQRLVLDQGYWKDTLMTPKDKEALQKDLELIKKMGFNGVRKHQKLEDPRFLYYADKMGVLVWEEMPSAYEYTDWGIRELIDCCHEMMERDYNHPCIITWVPFNESWGIRDVLWDDEQQHFAEAVYHLLYALDGTRLVSTNDGWESVYGDLVGIHDYENSGERLKTKFLEKEELMKGNAVEKMVCSEAFVYNGEPVLLSEFGGVAMEDGDENSWGYHEKASDSSALFEKMAELFEAVNEISYLNGYCYTQLTDVEQETNGILDVERNAKVNLSELQSVIQKTGFDF